ncbi:hypothetical protein HanRHA438_Chr11g0485041 [Helianthus annuus]|uniref:Uncharacterized protein n=1 Tax=Helianthus annuus TaxID=4232 RepID=A0A251T7G6_HELAN|nr:hypothetical protein HanXRQr2_Chr11g0471541 [Helianthus annuus]KAJ0500225.1 hypothetical protein HanHA300_Chr11g0387271 [Helianthus annuus]KAJ0507588.1 hypothetical protein HanIR_Chr11g0507911 [Helianthus annuus]KAJ0516057.1 hypothetical protein HanHA89_Chr11g0409641 [Helianthus annuus]KAJ0684074.1 hypothetical protein HanLR1_Chr11g0387231 [Helianthus annuus]
MEFPSYRLYRWINQSCGYEINEDVAKVQDRGKTSLKENVAKADFAFSIHQP